MAGQMYTSACRQKGAAERVVAGRARKFLKKKSRAMVGYNRQENQKTDLQL